MRGGQFVYVTMFNYSVISHRYTLLILVSSVAVSASMFYHSRVAQVSLDHKEPCRTRVQTTISLSFIIVIKPCCYCC